MVILGVILLFRAYFGFIFDLLFLYFVLRSVFVLAMVYTIGVLEIVIYYCGGVGMSLSREQLNELSVAVRFLEIDFDALIDSFVGCSGCVG